MTDFDAGDVVRLKSGGLEMTVTDPDIPLRSGVVGVRCVWFEMGEFGETFRQEVLPAACLARVVKPIEDSEF